MKVLIYAQHLSGVGHFMRSLHIAAALAKRHQVWMFDGGKPVPHKQPEGLHYIKLPRIHRWKGRLESLSDETVEQTLEKRTEVIKKACHSIQPDIVIIEHYPFSKWCLEKEIFLLCDHSKKLNPEVKLISSVRDILFQTKHEQVTAHEYETYVTERLNKMFSALLVHGDRNLTKLEKYFPRIKNISLPIFYTGIVTEPPSSSDSNSIETTKPYVLTSIGGGRDMAKLQEKLLRCWQIIQRDDQWANYQLLIFGGLSQSQTDHESDKLLSYPKSVSRMSFSKDFSEYLKHAALSVSCAGYNTCANLMSLSTPAILVANPDMSDQIERANLLHHKGYAVALPPNVSDERMIQTITQQLKKQEASHESIPTIDLKLDGANETVKYLESFISP